MIKPSKLSKLDQFKRLASNGYFRTSKRVWSFLDTIDHPLELMMVNQYQMKNYPGLLRGWHPTINFK